MIMKKEEFYTFMKRYIRPVLLTLGCGAAGGIVMALLLLYMMISTVFTTGGIGFILELLVAAALPLCLNVVRNEGIMLKTAQFLMVAVSFTITLYYAGYVSAPADFANMNAAIIVLSAILHGVSLASFLIAAGIQKFILKK
jgi:hypothetical protein